MMEIINLVRWQDILDVIIVAAIVYRVLLIIKGTRAAHMLTGLGLLFVAFLFSGKLRLYTIDWIIQSLWAQIVLAVIILFQPEIRKALAHMGKAKFLPSFSSAEELRSREEIVKASVSLSNRNLGALMVIERENSLDDIMEIGTQLDAKVSQEILLSIFHPSSPIHDGAVVIRGNRIISAGCFLPLTLSARLSKSFGTRHRAGIGLTEETDAVVIIVSEETGIISVAVAGKIMKNMDAGKLRDLLTESFSHAKGKKK
ncbi:MAG: TIGR00159 family protein [Nitrospirae bacterium]|nr:TIGR00159 family protein [Nitrospirota bacterium]